MYPAMYSRSVAVCTRRIVNVEKFAIDYCTGEFLIIK